MSEKSFEQFTEQRSDFELALEKSLAALDRSHYPESLLECMARVLETPDSLRGLPLLVECLASEQGRKVPSRLITGAEVCLRGLLLLADLELAQSLRPDKSQSFSLEKKFPPAHLLLTVDTLFTWAIELAAGQADNNGRPLAGIFSNFPGVDGTLLGLDIAKPDLEGLLRVEPVGALAGAVLVGEGLGEPAVLAARWIYLRELESWFGVSPGSSSAEKRDIEQRLNRMELESSSPSVVKQLALLVRFLK
jgi:hypothetical protein